MGLRELWLGRVTMLPTRRSLPPLDQCIHRFLSIAKKSLKEENVKFYVINILEQYLMCAVIAMSAILLLKWV